MTVIFGRPTNLWLGLVTAVAGTTTVSLVALGFDPVLAATLVGSGVTVLGSLIAIVAYQPPTLNPGDTFNVTTPAGQPNAVTTVATPPAADAPPTPGG
jgi:hypothetical protein